VSAHDIHTVRPSIQCTHHRVQIHMRVNKVWWRAIRERLSEEGKLRTVEVGAVGVDGWDSGDRHVETRRQRRLVRHRVETLRKIRRSALIRVTRSYLHRSDPFFTLGLRDGPPLAPHARFVARNSVHGCDGREEKSKERVLR